ncbi:MAG: glycosyltransferase WbuB [Actinomycetota bacterium]
MKILLYGINYSPELTGIGKYTGEMAEWLAAAGYEVRVVTAPPYHPKWRIFDGHANRWSRSGGRGGEPTVYRCPLWVPSRPSGVKRLLHLASFAFTSLPTLALQAFWKPDVVFVVAPPFLCAPQAWLAARLCGARAWLHIQDFEIDVAFDLGMLRGGWLKHFALSFERFWLRRFDRVSAISDKMLEKLHAKGVAGDNAVLFPNWSHPEEIRPLAGPNPFREELGLPEDSFIALYSGSMGEKQGLDTVLDAASALQGHPRIRFVLCGEGPVKAGLQERYQLPNVRWLPLQPLQRLNDLLCLADVHLLPQRGDVADLVMPSKLLGMLASGRPVLATAAADTQVGRVVAQCGVLSPADDSAALVEALLGLAGEPERRAELGAVGRWMAEAHFSKGAVLGKLKRDLTEAVDA